MMGRVEKPGFIEPPPGLIPAPPRETSETVRLGERRPVPMPAFVPAVPGAPAPPTAASAREPAPPAATPAWTLTLADGAVVRVEGALLLGRNPSPVAGWEHAGLVEIHDPGKTVSKTHAAVVVAEGALVVTDLHSTNGVAVVAPDGTVRALAAGERASVADGASIELGSYPVRAARS